MKADALINCYDCVADKKKLVDLNGTELAGYYLKYYFNDPIGMLNEDMYNLRVPTTVGSCAKTIIDAVKGS